MALTNLIKILERHPWSTYVVASLVLVLVEKLVEHDFLCPCRKHYTEAFFYLYLLMPLLLAMNFGVYRWKYVNWSNVEIPKRLRGNIWSVKILTCAVPSIFWLILFFGDGRFLACLNTPLKDESHIESVARSPWEWCDKNRTLTGDEYISQIRFYSIKIAVFGILSIVFLGVLICQCCDRHCVLCCGKCWGRCCGGCCVQYCGGCCVGCYEEYLDIRTENLPSSTYKVLCVAKGATKSTGVFIELSLCSVCDGTRVFLITLQRNQIHMFQQGETYMVTNATVKKNGLFDEMILESGTGVYPTAPLQLEENVFGLAMERCFSKITALNDPELYLKKSYITLTGRVVSTRTHGQNQVEKEIEQNGVRVAVLLLNEAATEPIQINQMIKITYIKVTKNKACGRKLTSSDHTVVSVLQEGAEEKEISFIKVEAFRTENNWITLLTRDQEELSVHQYIWSRDAGQLPEQLPVYLKVTRRDGQVTDVEVVKSQRTEHLRSSTYKVLCVSKQATKYSRHSIKLSLCSVCDGTRIFLITLQENQIHMFEEGKTYIVKNAKVNKDHLFNEIILERETKVFHTAPLQLEENIFRLAKESCLSKATALNDRELYLKQCYITLTGRVVSIGTPRHNQQGVLAKGVVIEQDGVSVAVLLLKEAANTPLQENHMIQITHVKVNKNKEFLKKLTSSDHTVISDEEGPVTAQTQQENQSQQTSAHVDAQHSIGTPQQRTRQQTSAIKEDLELSLLKTEHVCREEQTSTHIQEESETTSFLDTKAEDSINPDE